jgi:hypothetical protein
MRKRRIKVLNDEHIIAYHIKINEGNVTCHMGRTTHTYKWESTEHILTLKEVVKAQRWTPIYTGTLVLLQKTY